ncbi:ABC transporter permease [Paenibacillus ginsengarvi]|uniref:Sugar ABC transporter permease n=1 Tax=Paenibacillus ginsengarvi TaxID=400777 RepID=A0A3B0BUA6_9BACL|nr:ABC transporter permease subunit [Paenibacillus ginsengarvi]RKN76031.1 sugar ABC transporter permease [Paenibacillus ginsengarvi]
MLARTETAKSRFGEYCKKIAKDRLLYLLALPGICYFLIFKYAPMYGILIAFQDYNPFLGMFKSDWVGFYHFERLFHYADFWKIFRNTIVISLLNLIFFFPAPLLLSLLLHEVRHMLYKRAVQTVMYLPHFVSWVVIGSLTITFLDSKGAGMAFFASLGYQGQILQDESYFWGLVTMQSIWKEMGWGTIIFLAALAGINPELYEAARVDGASRWKQMLHITLPQIMFTIVLMLILRLGGILDLSFDQLYLMGNPAVLSVAEVFDTYVYKVGVMQGNFSYATAIGMFKSVIGLILVLSANYVARKTSEYALF